MSEIAGRVCALFGRFALLLAVLATPGCGGGGEGEAGEVVLTVSAAASLREALEAIASEFQARHPGVEVRLNLASTGTLQQQIQRGAPVDVFVSAATAPTEELQRRALLEEGTRRAFAGNELVLIVPAAGASPIHSFEDLAARRAARVAIGAPASVPAGAYALQVLRSLGIDGAVLAKAIRGQHVRQVLGYVELGEVDAGIVYATDAATSARVRVVAHAPQRSHDPIRYEAAVVAGARHPAAARAFVAFLARPEAQRVLRGLGFLAAP